MTFVFFQSVLHCYNRLPQIKAFKLSSAFVVSYFQRQGNSGPKNYQLESQGGMGKTESQKDNQISRKIQRE